MITQTVALFVDAYRELNSKKLFWFVLIVSGLFVAAFACIGISDKGLTIMFWDVPVPVFNTVVMSRAFFYRLMFYILGFSVWLTWAATILALISTAGIMPDFLSGGAIELSLSKPIGRLRLFLTKYLTGLLFVALQVTLFTLASFLVIGIRAGTWDWKMLWAIPVVVSFFSYLYAFSATIGMWSRSTIAAILITLLLWLAIVMVDRGEAGGILQLKVRQDQLVALREDSLNSQRERVERTRVAIAEARGGGADKPNSDGGAKGAGGAKKSAAELEALLKDQEEELADRESRLAVSRRDQVTLTNVHALIYAMKTVLPKTSETMELLRRIMLKDTELEAWQTKASGDRPDLADEYVDGLRLSNRSIQREVLRIQGERTLGWVLGTSLAFEAVLLGAGAWMFCRRDF